MKILLTGHKGFIGSHVYLELRNQGHDVTGIDRKDGNEIVGNDLIAETKFDVVIHCAANLYKDFDENIMATKYLLEAQKEANFIFTSSAAVYGNTMGARETDLLNPFGEYGKSKAEEEKLIRRNAKKSSILRLGNVYGYGTDHGVYQYFLNGGVGINYPGHIRDFVHVDFVVNEIINSMEMNGGIWNVSSGEGTTILELFERLNPGKKYVLTGLLPEEIEYSILL